MKTISRLLCGFVMSLILTVVLVFAFEYEKAVMNETEMLEESEPKIYKAETAAVYETAESFREPAAAEEIEADLIEPELIEPEPAAVFEPLDLPLDAEVQEYLKTKCEDANIDFAFVLALIDIESNFNPDAHSKTNDYGLMQINAVNHKWLSSKTGATDYLNAYDNIDAGMWLLERLFEKYEEAEPVLMAFHFGEGTAKKLWAQGKKTSSYSQAILEKQLIYSEMIENV